MAKIAFISELPFNGKVGRNHPHMRTEFAQFCALEADHYCYTNISMMGSYDHIILFISKSDAIRNWLLNSPDLVSGLRKNGDKIWFMQESTAQIYHKFELQHQIRHYNLLQEVDGILTENVTDYSYFKGVVGASKDIHTIPTLIIADNFMKLRNVRRENKTMIGGNFNEWYAGFDSYLIATEFDNHISVPKMRNVSSEDQLVEVLPHISFNEWMKLLSTYKYAVHLMPNITAGTFSLNCSFLGIPCIGYSEADTQRLCQPELSVEKYDLEKAQRLAKMLKQDDDFYNECSINAIQNHDKYFGEDVFLDYMKTILNK
jgi:hypothetical protein